MKLKFIILVCVILSLVLPFSLFVHAAEGEFDGDLLASVNLYDLYKEVSCSFQTTTSNGSIPVSHMFYKTSDIPVAGTTSVVRMLAFDQSNTSLNGGLATAYLHFPASTYLRIYGSNGARVSLKVYIDAQSSAAPDPIYVNQWVKGSGTMTIWKPDQGEPAACAADVQMVMDDSNVGVIDSSYLLVTFDLPTESTFMIGSLDLAFDFGLQSNVYKDLSLYFFMTDLQVYNIDTPGNLDDIQDAIVGNPDPEKPDGYDDLSSLIEKNDELTLDLFQHYSFLFQFDQFGQTITDLLPSFVLSRYIFESIINVQPIYICFFFTVTTGLFCVVLRTRKR